MNLKTVIGAITLACVGVGSTPAFAQQAGAQQPQGWMWGFGLFYRPLERQLLVGDLSSS